MKKTLPALIATTALGLPLLPAMATDAPTDPREVIELDEATRHVVLTEMRGFLQGVAKLTAALSREDMDTVAEVATSLGLATMRGMPAPAMQQLPAAFRMLGHGTHEAFDQIAMDARDLGDPKHSLEQLGATLERCVACHAAYQIRERRPTTK